MTLQSTRARVHRVSIVGLVAVLVVTGCSSGDDAAPDDPPSLGDAQPSSTLGPRSPDAGAEDLVGTQWRLVEIDRAGDRVDTSGAPRPAVVTFDAETVLGAYDGVNIATASYELRGDTISLSFEGPYDDIAYPEEDAPQYDLFELLPGVDRLVIEDGDLVLSGADGVTLRFAPAAGGVPSD